MIRINYALLVDILFGVSAIAIIGHYDLTFGQGLYIAVFAAWTAVVAGGGYLLFEEED